MMTASSATDWQTASLLQERRQTQAAIQKRLDARLVVSPSPVATPAPTVIPNKSGPELTEQFLEQYSANRKLINSFGIYEADYLRTCRRLHLQKLGYTGAILNVFR